MNPLIQSWLLQCLVIFLLIGGFAGMVVGVLLLLRPQNLQRASQLLNRWISTRHLDQALENTLSFDPIFYRYRHISSALTLLGAVYVIYFFTVSMDRPDTVLGLARYFKLPTYLIGGLLDALVLSALLGALFATMVSLFVLFRPSLLRDFEQGANRWVSLRRAMKPLEQQHAGLDEYVFKHGQQAGILLVLGSLYVLVFLLTWIGH